MKAALAVAILLPGGTLLVALDPWSGHLEHPADQESLTDATVLVHPELPPRLAVAVPQDVLTPPAGSPSKLAQSLQPALAEQTPDGDIVDVGPRLDADAPGDDVDVREGPVDIGPPMDADIYDEPLTAFEDAEVIDIGEPIPVTYD